MGGLEIDRRALAVDLAVRSTLAHLSVSPARALLTLAGNCSSSLIFFGVRRLALSGSDD